MDHAPEGMEWPSSSSLSNKAHIGREQHGQIESRTNIEMERKEQENDFTMKGAFG